MLFWMVNSAQRIIVARSVESLLEDLMPMDRASVTSIDAYIASFPQDVQERLQTVRATIHAAALDAEERISYLMPAFDLNGILVYFSAGKGYIGFYPTSSGVTAFERELGGYTSTKGAIHFPFNQPLPLDLITRIVQFRVAENREKEATRASKTRASTTSSKARGRAAERNV